MQSNNNTIMEKNSVTLRDGEIAFFNNGELSMIMNVNTAIEYQQKLTKIQEDKEAASRKEMIQLAKTLFS